jgi:hypothetical protein
MATADAEAVGAWLGEGRGAGLRGLHCTTRRRGVLADALLRGLEGATRLRRLRLASLRNADPAALSSLASLTVLEELDLWYLDMSNAAWQQLFGALADG